MSIFEDFAGWFTRNDHWVTELHLKKDRHALKEILSRLNDERSRLRSYLPRLENILEMDEAVSSKNSHQALTPEHLDNFEDRFSHSERRFQEIWSKKAEDRSDEESQFVAQELPHVRMEKQRIINRLRKLDEITAKTMVLIDDLDEDLCHALTGGHSLAAVGEALVEKLGNDLKESSYSGRSVIRQSLEKQYKLDKTASRKLFSLLEERGVLQYNIEFPEDLSKDPLIYYTAEMEIAPPDDLEIATELYGHWHIRS